MYYDLVQFFDILSFLVDCMVLNYIYVIVMVYLLPLTIITTDFSLVSFLRKHFNRQIIAGKIVKVKFQKSCRSLSLSKILF